MTPSPAYMAASRRLVEQLERHRLVPVIALARAADAAPLADALVAAGLPVAEITFRTEAAVAAIEAMAARGDMLVGAGTVLTPEQVDQARAAGATFVVSPGFNPRVVRHALDVGMPIVPGVSNPTDIEMALELGLDTLKFFPAEPFGGVATLKLIGGPYSGVRFMPSGGITLENLRSYLDSPGVVACGGSWMARPALYADGDFTPVIEAVRAAVAVASGR